MYRIHYFLLLSCSLVFATGCQTSGNQANNWFAGQTTVQPPQAYNLNIPSMAANPQADSVTGRSVIVNPSQLAPVPMVQTAGAWNRQGMVSPGVGQQNNGLDGTGFVETTGTASGSQFVNGALPVQSVPVVQSTYTNSVDYVSTQIDESRDESRLPVNDASAVIAPSGFAGNRRVATLPPRSGNQFSERITVPNTVGSPASRKNFMVNPVIPQTIQPAVSIPSQRGSVPQGWSMREASRSAAGNF
jgi:hypothetical protein